MAPNLGTDAGALDFSRTRTGVDTLHTVQGLLDAIAAERESRG